MRAPTPVFVAIAPANGVLAEPNDGSPSVALDEFFDWFAGRYPHTDLILLTHGTGAAECAAIASAEVRGAAAVRIAFSDGDDPERWRTFIEKHCPIVLTVGDSPVTVNVGARESTLEAIAEIDAWNADVAGRLPLDAQLCTQTFERADATAIAAQKHTY